MTFRTRRRRVHHAIAVVVAASLSASAAACAHADGRAERQQAAAGNPSLAAFLAGVKEYMAIHLAARTALPPLPSEATAEQIETRQRALGRLIEQARATASPGSVFTPDARAYFRTTLRRTLAGLDGPELLESILDENPGRIQLRVNARYPDGVPLSTVPYQVLAVLPPLPEELEYRFIGTRLVLLDAHAQLVVDYMDDALPR